MQNQTILLADEKWLLASIGAGIFLLALWMTIEAVAAFFSLRRPAAPQQRPDVST